MRLLERSRSLDDNAPICLVCGYCLAHLPIERCPECSHQFDLSDQHTYTTNARLAAKRRARLQFAFLVLGFPLVPYLLCDLGSLPPLLATALGMPYVMGTSIGRRRQGTLLKRAALSFLAPALLIALLPILYQLCFPQADAYVGFLFVVVLGSLFAPILTGCLFGALVARSGPDRPRPRLP
ncbi:MAG: hypothetical protein JSU63_06120 [Phycisphaerales bacterium]|nr:MAG: hypothetical protein JSU63_06120 [Phycisphaerales bacterium]